MRRVLIIVVVAAVAAGTAFYAFAESIDQLAKQLSTAATKALVRTRQAMHAAPTHTLEQQLSMEGSFMRELGWSPDYTEGVAAFMQKRIPEFKGD